ncbi:ADP-glyceromanno-heptose 6-epimerase, partial [Campylobacter coli]
DETWDYKPKFSLEEGIEDYLEEIKRLFEKEVNA